MVGDSGAFSVVFFVVSAGVDMMPLFFGAKNYKMMVGTDDLS